MNIHQLAQSGITLLFVFLYSFASSQSMLTTQPLNITSTCPGSIIRVPYSFTYTSSSYTGNTRFTVQLSNGGDYFDIPTIAGGDATIPKGLTPGVTYSVRMTSKNPDLISDPSPTKLFMKGGEAKPPVPRVDSLNVDCMSTNQSSMSGLYANISFKLVAGATPRLYNDATKSFFIEYAEFPLQTKLPTGEYVRDLQNGYFQISKTGKTSNTYVYPVYEGTYYISQILDGCESEPVASKLRILWKTNGGPGLVNPRPNNSHFGSLNYCQGDQSYPLNVNGHTPPPENYQVRYQLDSLNFYTSTTIPPIPDTHIVGSKTYILSLAPTDPSKVCQADPPYNNLTVNVYPVPTKPTATTGLIEYYQEQPAQPLSASTTINLATLVWYGTSATGGTGSTTAPLPPTNQSGEFTYYVAQKIGICEGERTAIRVRINPLLGLDDIWLETHSQVYPNPVNSRLTVQVDGVSAQQPASLEMLDLTGHSLQKYTSQREISVLNLETYSSGSYFLRIQTGNRQTIKRIVKQ